MTNVHIVAFNADEYRDKITPTFPELNISIDIVSGKATERFDDAEILIGFGPAMTDELIASASALKWVQALGTGVDGFDDRVDMNSVLLSSMRGIHGPQMSEMAFLMMLSFSRQLPRLLASQAESKWDRFTGAKLEGKTISIIGVGLIADALAVRCKAFGMTVSGVTGTPREITSFDHVYSRDQMTEAVADADFVVALAPLTEQSRGMIDGSIFAAMGPDTYFINLARGGVVNEADLLTALRNETIAGAALDVFVEEPLPADSPFWLLPNVILTPHMGGRTEGYADQAMPILHHNLRAYLDGEPEKMKNRVTG